LNVALLNPDLAPADLAGAVALAEPVAAAGHPDSVAKLGLQQTFFEFRDEGRPPEAVITDPADFSVIVFTSGTTGRPKGVQHTHAGMFACVAATFDVFPLEDGCVMMSILPHFHLHGLMMTVILPQFCAGTTVVAPAFGPFLAPRLWDLIRRYEVNHFSGVPGILGVMADFFLRLDAPPPPSLRFGFCASAPLSAEARAVWFDRIQCPIANNYGLSEASSWVAFGPLDREPETTVGRPTVCDIRVVDDDGHPLPHGKIGEVTIAGAQLMHGYVDNPEQTALALRDGRLFTGDLGWLDEAGWLYLKGRKAEMINVGGLKVAPMEIEGAAKHLPGVAEVAAFGYPDPRLGEVPALAVVPAGQPPTVTEVRRLLAPILTAYKLPRKVFLVEALPRNALGKLQRTALRQRFVPGNADA